MTESSISYQLLAWFLVPAVIGVLVVLWYLIKENRKAQKERDDKQDLALQELAKKFENIKDNYATKHEVSDIKESLLDAIKDGFKSVKELLIMQAKDITREAIMQHIKEYHSNKNNNES